ncbi:MAG: adenosylcobinamide-GDP ribazoletransferase [Methylococcales bacterium]
MNQLKSFLVALQFLTILPVYFKQFPDAKTTGGSIVYYPLIGVIIGLLLVFVGLAGNHLPANICASLILVCWVVITGALHLDGLADSADAWLGGLGDRTRTLAIMKDPACGPFAVVTLVLLLLVKFVALQQIVLSESWLFLVIVPVLARSMPVLLFITTPYVRTNGIGNQLAKHLPYRASVIVLLFAALIVFGLLGFRGVQLIFILICLFIVLRMLMILRIGGMTGDTAGATLEISEIAMLLVVVLM